MQEETPTAGNTGASSTSTRFACLGLGLLLLAWVAVLTGIALIPFYRAEAGAAYPSVQAIQASPVLRVVRGVHHWASALVLILGALYLLYGLFSGSYRRPHHIAWLAAVALVLLFFAFQLTGHLLPWDRQAVSTAAIETGIAENVPVVGPVQARVMRGSDAVSPQTLKIWYLAHIALFPIALVVLPGLFLSHWRRSGEPVGIPWIPVAAALALILLGAVALPLPLGAPGTSADYTSFSAPPEWYTSALHSLLTLAQTIRPSLAFIGTMVIPGVVVLGLLVLPWLDRNGPGDPPSRAVQVLGLLGVVGAIGLTLMNAREIAPPFGSAEGEGEIRIVGNPPPVNVPLDPALVQRGKTLYAQNGCAGCHKVGGRGGGTGPPLDGEGARRADLDWQVRHLKNPRAVKRGSTMPAFGQLKDPDLRALATYLLSLK